MAAKARLLKDRVLVPDEKEANTLYNKGAFGLPQSGGGLALDLAEALYLVENKRLAIEGEDAGSLLHHASRAETDFEVRYIVYRDLRGRSFVVKPSNLSDYNLYPRTAIPGRAASTHLVRAVSERGSLDVAATLDAVSQAQRHQKILLLALVDEEGDLTYYEAKEERLDGGIAALPEGRASASLLADRVVVTDPEGRRALFEGGYFGRDLGLALQLSLPEALYLLGEGKLRVLSHDGRSDLDAEALADEARRVEPDFDLRYDLYRDLRRRGVVVKTGFKYGTHFRAYVGAPDEEHAPYLVHAVAPKRQVPWAEVAGFVRLAHGVRKRFYFATRGSEGFRLLELTRRKP